MSDRPPAVRCVLIAGAIGAGKTTVARELAATLEGEVVGVRQALADLLEIDVGDRAALQERGADLDRRTNGRWLLEFLERRTGGDRPVIVDSVRTRRQTVPVLERLVGSRLAYLDARPETREHRFNVAKRFDAAKRSMSFSMAMSHPTEIEVETLRAMSHIIVETDGLSVAEVVEEIASALSPSD